MKKIKIKQILCAASVLTLFFTLCAKSDAAYCNSPCPNPCSPSRTVCEGSNCTTYCNSLPSVTNSAVYYTTPGVSFSYSTPNVSFSISNEVYGAYNYYSRPNFVISNGFRPVYHRKPVQIVYKVPPKPHNGAIHQPPHKPIQKPSHKPIDKRRH